MDEQPVPQSAGQPQSPLDQPMPVSPKPSSKTPLLIGLFFLIAVGVGGYLFGKNSFPLQPVQPVVTSSPAPAVSVDPTANWKAYTNQKQNFSFQYPPTTSVTEQDNPAADQFQVFIKDNNLDVAIDVQFLRPN